MIARSLLNLELLSWLRQSASVRLVEIVAVGQRASSGVGWF